ncbi:Na+/H+ antiporter NhaA [Nonomuraea gerenzanensis]|uniref:Na+/H+ antiporter NhaA n=1 Tax=Nonomuraea gerenzanensis TaxID=93944 RepID=UPI001CD9BB49|nr:Na+/H+ antiporter NhaA [Nonomuraea gerenzanensis]
MRPHAPFERACGLCRYVRRPRTPCEVRGAKPGGQSVGDILSDRVVLGVLAGLVLGKFLGVFGGAWPSVRPGLARLVGGAPLAGHGGGVGAGFGAARDTGTQAPHGAG